MRALPVLLASFALLAAPRAPAETQTLSVAAASDLQFAFDELARTFAARRPDLRLRPSFGSSGNFFAQIQNGAPFDVFLSADVDYARRLHAAGRVEGDVFVYAVGRLALWAPAGSPLDLTRGLASLRDPAARRIALANPRHAPYGRAAVAALRAAGLFEALEARLVYAENVAQAASFVQSGAADVGLIAWSLASAPALAAGRRFELRLSPHEPLLQGGVLLKTSRAPQAGRALRDFLLGPEGRALLARRGFLPPPTP